LNVAAGVVYSLLLLIAAVADLRTRRIPNALVALLAAMGLVLATFGAAPAPGLRASALGLVTGLACWLPFYAAGWLGAGDVKMFAAASAWLGPLRALEGAGIAALAGGLLGITWMFWRYGTKGATNSLMVAASDPSLLAPSEEDLGRSRRALPYGVALAIGALAAGWMPKLLVLR